jgi:mRNA-degrading endonuclease RelE of RelBE toxin-antitoxin system
VSYQLAWEADALATLRTLARRDAATAQRIRQRTAAFAATGRGDVKKLTGSDREWRLRVGDWRVIFVFDPPGTITVLAVLLRRDAFRRR